MPDRKVFWRSCVAASSVCLFVAGVVVSGGAVDAQDPDPREGTCELAGELFPDTNPGPGTLKEIPVPEPTNLGTYVRNRNAAIALGKALFWDMQVGSDGVQACGSCHFRGGADPRSINQANPGGADNPDPTIDLGGPNSQLRPSDFPLHQVRGLDRPALEGAALHRRRRVVAGRPLAAVPGRGARRDRGQHRSGTRPGVQHSGHQHAPGGAP